MPTPHTHPIFIDLFDYAGLFPPANLDMPAAVANYAAYKASPHNAMLARFVVPLAKLEPFEHAAAQHLPKPAGNPAKDDEARWRLSAIINPDADLNQQIDAVFDFNQRHEEEPDHGLAEIDALELRAASPRDIDHAMNIIPEQLDPYFELDHANDIRGHLTALAGTGGNAKIRCGGVTPDKIPSCQQVAAFIASCAQADVPFKFTAGLHHPIRKEQPLTYENNPPRATMHGFINVLTAATLALTRRLNEHDLTPIINENDPAAFRFHDDAISWNNHTLTAEDIHRARDAFAISIGSCSFTEPVEDLSALGILKNTTSATT